MRALGNITILLGADKEVFSGWSLMISKSCLLSLLRVTAFLESLLLIIMANLL